MTSFLALALEHLLNFLYPVISVILRWQTTTYPAWLLPLSWLGMFRGSPADTRIGSSHPGQLVRSLGPSINESGGHSD